MELTFASFQKRDDWAATFETRHEARLLSRFQELAFDARQMTTASRYSPNTFLMVSEISPTVALDSIAERIRGIRFSPERAASSTCLRADLQQLASRRVRNASSPSTCRR